MTLSETRLFLKKMQAESQALEVSISLNVGTYNCFKIHFIWPDKCTYDYLLTEIELDGRVFGSYELIARRARREWVNAQNRKGDE